MIRALMMAAVLGLTVNAFANEPTAAAPAEQAPATMEAGKKDAAAPADVKAEKKAKKHGAKHGEKKH